MKKLSLYSVVCVVAALAIGCGGGSSATQYTLGVEGSYTITPSISASASKIDTATPQVMIGTTLVEVNIDDAQSLGVDFRDFSLQPQVNPAEDLEFMIQLTPSTSSYGTIFKLDDAGVPYGTSIIDLDLSVSSPSDIEFVVTPDTSLLEEGRLLHLGTIRFEADATDRTRIPVLGGIPTIGFLFRGEERRVEMDDLLIILTPQIIKDTE